MLVGIDGGALSINDDRLKVGVYKVTKRLLEYIPHIGYSNNYRIYRFSKVGESDKIFFSPNIEERRLFPSIGYQKVRLPLELLIHPVNVFLGLSQMIPFSLSHNIGFIYDLRFLHSPGLYPGTSNKLKKNTEYLIHHSDKIITISEKTKSDCLNFYHISPNLVSVCYPGVDENFNHFGKKYQQRNPYFLYVGSLSKSKNIPQLIDAFNLFIKLSKKQIDLILVGGDYWFDPNIKSRIKSLGLHQRITMTGYVNDNQLAEYYRGAVAFITLSKNEGFCLPVVEAMASGIPVIAANSGAIPELTGTASLLVDPENFQEITSRMLDILKKNVREKLVSDGMNLSKKYTWKSFAQNVYRIIASYE
jgi:glycosyltransferase involved in cell wall biosynthesis